MDTNVIDDNDWFFSIDHIYELGKFDRSSFIGNAASVILGEFSEALSLSQRCTLRELF